MESQVNSQLTKTYPHIKTFVFHAKMKQITLVQKFTAVVMDLEHQKVIIVFLVCKRNVPKITDSFLIKTVQTLVQFAGLTIWVANLVFNLTASMFFIKLA